MLGSPFNVLRQANHFEHRRRIMPGGEDERWRRLPASAEPGTARQHFPKLIPNWRERTYTTVLPAIRCEAFDLLAIVASILSQTTPHYDSNPFFCRANSWNLSKSLTEKSRGNKIGARSLLRILILP